MECDKTTVNEDVLSIEDHFCDEVYAVLPEPTPEDPTFQPISEEELHTEQLSDPFCVSIRSRLNEGAVLPFGFNFNGLLCRKVEHDQIVIPHALKSRVLHINHYSRLAGHPGGRKLYMSIKRHM